MKRGGFQSIRAREAERSCARPRPLRNWSRDTPPGLRPAARAMTTMMT